MTALMFEERFELAELEAGRIVRIVPHGVDQRFALLGSGHGIPEHPKLGDECLQSLDGRDGTARHGIAARAPNGLGRPDRRRLLEEGVDLGSEAAFLVQRRREILGHPNLAARRGQQLV